MLPLRWARNVQQGQEGWFHACTTTYWTSLNFFRERETYQILQPPRGMDEIAQTWFMNNLDNSIYKKMSLGSPSANSNTSKAMKRYWTKVD